MNEQEVIDRIRKLLNHRDGCLKIKSEEEAFSALDLANKLMKKYHLTSMQLHEKCPDDIIQQNTDTLSVYSVPLWMRNIVNVVDNICNCKSIIQKTPNGNIYKKVSVIFVAQNDDMEYIMELYKFLKKSMYKLCNSHVKDVKGNYTNWRSFAEGFTSRLLERSKSYKKVNKDDVQEAESVEDEEFEEDVCVNKNTTELQLYNYLNDVSKKIDDYIKTNIKNIVYEKKKIKSMVCLSSYNIGREKAEKQQLAITKKNHRIKEKTND